MPDSDTVFREMRMNHMKWLWLGLTIFGLAGVTQATSHLTLGVEDGLTTESEVAAYNGLDEPVQLLVNGVMTNCPFSSFTPETRSKIIEWAVDETFLSHLDLRITLEKKVQKRHGRNNKSESVSYVVAVNNRSSNEVRNVTITYRIFFNRQRGVEDKRRDRKYFTKTQRVNIGPHQAVTFETSPVIIRDMVVLKPESNGSQTISRGFGGSVTVPGSGISMTELRVRDQLKGVHVELSRPDRDGCLRKREYKNGSVPRESSWEDYTPFSGSWLDLGGEFE